MVELSGLDVKDAQNPDGDIQIQEIGLRPGEKLYEELLIDGDPEKTLHPRIFKSHEDFMAWEILREQLDLLEQGIRTNNQDLLINLLRKLVSGYSPAPLA
jgi:FlaA1/EpsC-like NDP-sugar epimerase